jgi:molybdopterin-guanine dinucleotide biosynthesis protein A
MHTQLSNLPETLSGAILAGGQGRRMGYVNKGLVSHQGRYLFEYAVNNLRPHVSDLVIVTNTDAERYQALGYEAIHDEQFRGQGPLAGFLAALVHARTPYVAFAPCDQGPLPEDVYPLLFGAARESVVHAAILSDGENRYPTCAVLGVELAAALRTSLKAGQRRLMDWCEENSVESVCYPGFEYRNFNTPQDLAVD